MAGIDPGERCPCGGGAYEACCGPLHAGATADTALRLMRSRYSAFALGLGPYLLDTWHPSTRPGRVTLDHDVRWRRLQIVDTVRGGPEDVEGVVEFRAAFRADGRAQVLHERSRFSRDRGRWVYVDGVQPE